MRVFALLGLVLLTSLTAACKEEKADPATSVVSVPETPIEEFSAETPNALPPGLLVDGAPIDPFCFAISENLESGLKDVPVKDCKSEDMIPGEHFAKGPVSFGVNYDYAGEAHSMSAPYMLYQFVGQDLTLPPSEAKEPVSLPGLNKEFPIILYSNTGGTGNFSTLLWVKRDGDFIKPVRTVAGGDRCNGGVVSAYLDGKTLRHEQNITPYDLIVLGGPSERPSIQNVEAYKEIEACAACCSGTAEFKDDEFTRVKLTPDLAESLRKGIPQRLDSGWSKQICFDKKVLALYDANKTEFTKKEWETFIQQVEGECFAAAP